MGLGAPSSGSWEGPIDIALDCRENIYVPVVWFNDVKIWKAVQ